MGARVVCPRAEVSCGKRCAYPDNRCIQFFMGIMSVSEKEKSLPAELQQRLERISADDFALFLAEKNIGRLFCPMCRSRNMSIPLVEAFGYAVIKDEPSHSPRYSFIEFICIDPNRPASILSYQYRIICKNCGFTSHYAVHPVVEWVESRDNNRVGG